MKILKPILLATILQGIIFISFSQSPLILNNVPIGAITDSFLTITGGNVKKLPMSSVTSVSWILTGNSGTTPGTNFIGTSDNKDIVFKRNNVQAGLLNASLFNSSWGVLALNSGVTGNNNTAIGYQSMAATTGGSNNTAIGYQSLLKNTSGTYNTANGWSALVNNTTGNNNTGLGIQTLYNNTSGMGNTAIGYNAGYTDGTTSTPGNLTNATAIGYSAQVTTSNSLVLGGTGGYAVNVGIGTTAPAAKLDVNGTGRFTGTVTVATTNPLMLTGLQTGALSDSMLTIIGGVVKKIPISDMASLGISGSGTANYITKYTGSNTVGSSNIYDNGSNVGIGVTVPASKLDVAGSIGNAITTTAGSLTLDGTHNTVIITGGTGSITLPAAFSAPRRKYNIINQTGSARTISSFIGYNGAGTTTIASQSAIVVQSNGTSWYRVI